MTNSKIAVLIDGSYFLKRLRRLVQDGDAETPEQIVKWTRRLVYNHVRNWAGEKAVKDNGWQHYLYRAFFYDALPYSGKAQHPITGANIDYSKSAVALKRLELFELLRKQPKVALRLGRVTADKHWTLNSRHTKAVVKVQRLVDELKAIKSSVDSNDQRASEIAASILRMEPTLEKISTDSVARNFNQKGVDMRIGTDIASIVLKKQASTIVLVSGDSDFVPAAKLARREGAEFILDPLWQQVSDELHEHIDSLKSGLSRPKSNDDQHP